MADPTNPNQFLQDWNRIVGMQDTDAEQNLYNMSLERDNSLTNDNQIILDFSTLRPVDFRSKYGDDVTNRMSEFSLGAQRYQNFANNTERSQGEAGGDLVRNILSGVNNTLGNVAVSGTAAVAPMFADEASQLLKGYNNWSGQFMSDGAKRVNELDAMRTQLDNQDIKAQRQIDINNGDNTVTADLKAIGRDAVAGVGRMIESPEVLQTQSEKAIGSLLAGGAVIKGLSALGSALTGAAFGEGAAQASTTATVSSMSALAEGGGSYADTANQVLDMSHDDLMKGSASYRELISTGMSEQAAKERIANQAGSLALGLTAPIAIATGKLAPGIEANPFTPKNINQIASEFLEEGIQSGTGTLAGNIAVQQQADSNQSIAEGVGAAAAQGAITGAVSAGVTQAPGATLQLAGTAAVGAVNGTLNALGAVSERGKAIREANETASPVSAQNIEQDIVTATEAAPQVVAGLRETIEAPPEYTETLSRVENATKVMAQDLSVLPDNLKANIPEGSNRFTAIKSMVDIAGNADVPMQDRFAAGLFLMEQVQNHERTFFEEMPALLEQVPQDSELYNQYQGYSGIINSIFENPEVSGLIEALGERFKEAQTEEITTDNAQQIGDNIANLAVVSPEAVNVEKAEAILYQNDQGNITLTPERRRGIQNSISLVQAELSLPERTIQEEAPEDEADALVPGATDAALDVADQILNRGGKTTGQFSMPQHVARFNDAVQTGDTGLARQRLRELKLFAWHMRNKVAAARQSLETGERATYKTLDPRTHTWLDDKDSYGLTIHNSEGSKAWARRIEAEAKAVTELMNDLAQKNPELNVNPLPIASLGPAFAEQAAKAPISVSGTEIAEPTQTIEVTEKTETKAPEAVSDSEQLPLGQDENNELTSDEVKLLIDLVEDAKQTEENVKEGFISFTMDNPNTVDKLKALGVELRHVGQKVYLELDQVEKLEGILYGNAPAELAKTTEIQPAVIPEAAIELEKELQDDKIARRNQEKEEEAAQPDTGEIVQEQPLDDPDQSGTQEQTLETSFPHLIRTKGKNWFFKAFRLPKVASSRILDLPNPIKNIQEILDGVSSISAFMGKKPRYTITIKNLDAYYNLMGMTPKMKKAMVARLQEVFKQDNIAARLQKGEEMNRFGELRALNIVEEINSKYRYNPQLLETAIIAGLHWSINGLTGEGNLTEKEVADILGIPEDAVTPDQFAEMNRGLSKDHAVHALANTIRSFWGVQKNRNTSIAYTDGIPLAMASEIMVALEAQGLISQTMIEARDENGIKVKDLIRILFDEREDNLENIIGETAGASNLLEDLFVVEPKRKMSIGEKITDIPRSILRAPNVELTKQQRQVIEKVQAIPYQLDTKMAELMLTMGEEAFLTMMGGVEDTKDLNVNHKKSVDGKNRTILHSFRNMKRHIADVIAVGEDAPIYYGFDFNVVNRLQMGGLNNPQSDKLARHIFLPTRAVLDMRDANGKDATNFWLTIAQAVGVKTEKEKKQIAVEQAQNLTMVEGYKPLVDMLVGWLKSDKVPDNMASELQAAFGDKLTVHAIHGLVGVAKLRIATENNTLQAFEHFGYLEADGKTNGPINSLMLFATGGFSPEWLKLVAKGGVFLGELNKSLNDHISNKVDTKDLYETVTDALQNRLAIVADTVAGGSAEPMNKALNRLMATFNMDIKLDANGDLVLSRGVAKNPLTISIYGSGINGIAKKVTKAIIDEIYAQMSEVNIAGGNKSLDQFVAGRKDSAYAGIETLFSEDMDLLTENYTVYSKNKDKYYTFPSKAEVKNQGDNIRDFTFGDVAVNNLTANVKTLFVDPLAKAIDETVMGHVKESTKNVQKAAQIQSIILASLFQNALARKLAEKEVTKPGDYRAGDFLSENELQEIYDNLLPFSPLVQTGTQNFFLSGKERREVLANIKLNYNDNNIRVKSPENIGSALFGEFRNPASVFAPTLAGVSPIPNLNIGTGDGQMIQNILMDGIIGLPTFDGFHMGADKIDDYSPRINKAVYETWKNNPVRNVYDSFRTTILNDGLSLIYNNKSPFAVSEDYFVEEMSKVLRSDDPVSRSQIEEEIGKVMDKLRAHANNIDLRHQAIDKLAFSIDQMASGEGPYVSQGKVEIPAGAEISDVLNGLMVEEQAKAENKTEERRTKAETAVKQSLEVNGTKGETGVVVVSGSRIAAFVDDLVSKAEDNHKDMIKNTIKILDENEYTIVLGNAQQLEAWELENRADRYDPKAPREFRGRIDIGSKTIYLNSFSPETLAHELIHAATFEKVQLFKANPEKLSKEDRDALIRIEGLMNEWLILDHSKESPEVQDSVRMAQATILTAKTEAEAINEFMAWSLTNKDIAEVQKKVGVKNPLFKLMGDMFLAVKQLIWGTKFAPKIDDSLYYNLRFNTRILLATPTARELLTSDLSEVSLYQSASFGSNDRLTALRTKFTNRINALLSKAPDFDSVSLEVTKYREALAIAVEVREGFIHAGFHMDMQQKSTFDMITATLATNAELNSNSLGRIEELYDQVIKEITPTDLRENNDPQDQADIYQAQERYNQLTGAGITRTDKQGRSALMSSFLALGMVSENFRKVLQKIEKLSPTKTVGEGLDGAIDNLGNALVNELAQTVSGEGRKNKTVLAALDALTESLTENVNEQRTAFENKVTEFTDKADQLLADNINKAGDYIIRKSNEVKNNTKNPVIGGLANVTRLIGTLANETASEKAVQGISQALNHVDGFNIIRDAFNEVRGRSEDNASIFDMISKSRSMVSQARQQFREKVPGIINGKFKTTLDDNQKAALFKGLAKTDVAVLASSYGLKKAMDLVTDPSLRNAEITRLEASLKASDGIDRFTKLQEKAQQLAVFMTNGQQGRNLLRNAYAVAHLFGERRFANIAGNRDAIIGEVDQLISLYALNQTGQTNLDIIADLSQKEKDGIEYVVSYLMGQRTNEQNKINGFKSRINHYKGYIPSESQSNVSLVVAKDSEYAKLLSMGYTKLGPYKGSSADVTVGRRSYYFAPVSGRATYNQGVMQTVHQTVSGVDPNTGFTVGEMMAGRIVDPQLIGHIQSLARSAVIGDEMLLPIYDEKGKIIAFERGVDPKQLARLNRSTDLPQMLGAWRGRQIEEIMAGEMNKSLVDNAYDIYQRDIQNKRGGAYVRMDQSNDPIVAEAWRLFPQDTKDYIKSKFGKAGFMVRRDNINDIGGFRQASVGDFWTGESRWKPETQKEIMNFAMGLFGNKAYTGLIQSERFVQDVVLNAKLLIVVKSVIVPVANLVSNIFQLAVLRGVPLRDILTKLPKKTDEINRYIKWREKEIALGADLHVAKGRNNSVQIRKIETQLQSIQDAYKRMSIWPLIQAGEFNAISDTGVSREDMALANGRWASFIDGLADKLPDGPVRNAYRYGLLTRDTPIFQALSRATQYGDFISKAILYEDLIQRKKVSPEEAMADINEEYINYNRLAGRSRNYLESVGLMWFWHFKLRAMKIANRTLRRNPVRALMFMNFAPNLPVIGSIGSPLTDNMATVLNDGRLGYSIGPGQGLAAPFLNPWVQIHSKMF